jgi:hypothetical protein
MARQDEPERDGRIWGWWGAWVTALMPALMVVLLWLGASPSAMAQQASGTDPRNKHCQTLLTCNYARGGQYRGCLSSYTCRVCRPQQVRCTRSDIASGRRLCTELVCSWGG